MLLELQTEQLYAKRFERKADYNIIYGARTYNSSRFVCLLKMLSGNFAMRPGPYDRMLLWFRMMRLQIFLCIEDSERGLTK